MKIHLKFDHTKKHCLEALDCPYTIDESNEQVNNVIEKMINAKGMDKKSQLAELINQELDYSIILYLATNLVTKEMEKRMMKIMLNQFLDDDDELI
jgi:hypothetical protein